MAKMIQINRKMPDGSYKHFYGRTREEARKKYETAVREWNDDAAEAAKGTPFLQLSAEWWAKRQAALSPNTARTYERMRRRINERFGSCYAQEITPQVITAWLETDFADKARKTANNYKILLSDILQYGHDYYGVDNTARGTSVPAGLKKGKRKMPDDNQMKIITEHYADDWALRTYYVLAFTGLRLGEALALQWKDIDIKAETISVTKSVYFEHGLYPKLKDPKTEAGYRVIPYLPQVQAVLEPLRGDPDYYVFHNQQGDGLTPMTRKGYTSLLAHAKAQGVTSTPHTLRHAFATLCCESGIDARTAGALFGWKDAARMENIYAEIRAKKMMEAGKLLAGAKY